jgi:hypothetical protein
MRRVNAPLTAILMVAVLLFSGIAGIVFYYNTRVTDLNVQISDLKGQLSNLTAPSANIVTALGTAEVVPYNSGFNDNPIKFNNLYISGSVDNVGGGLAQNAGLKVVAYNAQGVLEINMSVPLAKGAEFGTDAPTNTLVSNTDRTSSLQLGSLCSQQNVTIGIAIFHEGTVTNWTVTPVWTNTS